MSALNHKIFIRNKGGYKTEIISGKHSLTADEPFESGGTDSGMNPYELFLSALGSC